MFFQSIKLSFYNVVPCKTFLTSSLALFLGQKLPETEMAFCVLLQFEAGRWGGPKS